MPTAAIPIRRRRGKKPGKAKALELGGWDYPKNLAGRVFSVVVHGDTVGAKGVRRALHNRLSDLELIPAASTALVDRYYCRFARSM